MGEREKEYIPHSFTISLNSIPVRFMPMCLINPASSEVSILPSLFLSNKLKASLYSSSASSSSLGSRLCIKKSERTKWVKESVSGRSAKGMRECG